MYKVSPLFYSGISDLEHLRRLLAEKDEKIAKLVALLLPTNNFPKEWKLTENETILLTMLLAHSPHYVSEKELIARLAIRYRRAGLGYLYSVVASIRKKIHPIKITNVSGHGYCLTQESTDAINQANQLDLFPDYTEHS